MKTKQELSDLSLCALISLYNYLKDELDLLDDFIGSETKIESTREELIALQREIEERRSNLFIH